jgi:hypothetical protein
MNATYFISVWIVVGVATLILAIYRHILTVHQEEDVVHLADSEQREIAKQTSLARRLKKIDSWGMSMTVVVTLIGLGLGTAYLYQAWESPHPGPNNFYRMNTPYK